MSHHRQFMGYAFQDTWNPTIFGRIEANGDVAYMYASEIVLSGIAVVDARSYIYVIKGASDTYIRVARYYTDTPLTDQWYNTVGVGQGSPGAYPSSWATVFQLNDIPDTINIYRTSQTQSEFPSFPAIGSYTSDDKVTFFNPTQDVKYGGYVDCHADAGPGFDQETEEGTSKLQVTFRKAGRVDYTITFKVHAKAVATAEL